MRVIYLIVLSLVLLLPFAVPSLLLGDPYTTQLRAREIMGENYFGPQDAADYLNVILTTEQVIALRHIPFSETELTAKRNSHILAAVVPLSVLQMRRGFPELFYADTNPWYKDQDFVGINGLPAWHLEVDPIGWTKNRPFLDGAAG